MRRRWHPKLILITAIEEYGESRTLQRVREFCQRFPAGAVMVQLRDKGLSARERLRVGEQLREITAEYRQGLTVNDRLDLAWLLDADGLHLGESAIEADDARRVLGQGFWISRACHEPGRVDESQVVDAVLLAPVLASRKGRTPLGLKGIERARERLERDEVSAGALRSIQLYALGGVELGSLRDCESAGADGVAVIGAAWRGDPWRG